jgi:hypothetical protein
VKATKTDMVVKNSFRSSLVNKKIIENVAMPKIINVSK